MIVFFQISGYEIISGEVLNSWSFFKFCLKKRIDLININISKFRMIIELIRRFFEFFGSFCWR